MTNEQITHLRKLLADASPEPWWADGVYRENESGLPVIAANTDCGPMPGNPTRGMVAWVTELLPEYASTCEANAALIVALRNNATAMLDEIEQLRGALGRVQPIMRDYHGWVMANDLDMTPNCPDECLGEAADELARILFPNEPHDARAALGDE